MPFIKLVDFRKGTPAVMHGGCVNYSEKCLGGAFVLRSKSRCALINFVKVNYLLIGIIVGSLLLFAFVYPQEWTEYLNI